MLPLSCDGEDVTKSKFGHELVTMFLDPQGKENIADKLVEDCYFVVRTFLHTKKSELSSLGPLPLPQWTDSAAKLQSTGTVSSAVDCRSLSQTDESSRIEGRGRRRRRSMMGRLVDAVAQLEITVQSPALPIS